MIVMMSQSDTILVSRADFKLIVNIAKIYFVSYDCFINFVVLSIFLLETIEKNGLDFEYSTNDELQTS